MADHVPANIAPFVEVLGPDLALEFLLTFGGAELYLSSAPRKSALVELVGQEKAAELAAAAEGFRGASRPPSRGWPRSSKPRA